MKAKRATPNDIDEYIAAFSSEIQEKLEAIRTTIRKAAPRAEEKISYQMPTFALHGNLVHFAAFAKHIGFYPSPAGIEAFKKELAAYETGKGSVQFPLDQPIPHALLSRIVKFRVQQNLQKAEAKRKK
ncbi:MAG TPA: DUF1801 domain-containing protein [Burkholderiales bacterium]|nr:DUF1801 domain-containing protein [Burkholderiales bacterium]